MAVFRGISGALICLAATAQPGYAQGVAEVQVSPPTVTLSVGQDGGVFATAYDANGNVLVGQHFRWTSSNPNVVRVTVDEASSDVATLVAVNPGVARVEARIGSRSGTAAVQVVAAGGVPAGRRQTGTGPATVIQIEPGNILMLPAESRQLIPEFLKDDGSLAAPTTVTWRSLNAAVATVNDGLVVAISQGEGIIEVSTSNGLVARAPVRVSAAPFGFSTPVLSLSPEVERTVEVVVPSQGGRSLPNNALSWRSSDESIVRITPLGIAHAVAAGQATITASGFLQEQTLPVRVHRPVSVLTLRPRSDRDPIAVPMGGSVQFEVQALAEEDSTPVPDAPLTWTVSDTSIARFDGASQVLSGKAIGETELHLVGPPGIPEVTWQINVIAGGLLADPRRFGIGVGETLAIDVAFTDQAGTPIGPATSVAWTSSDEHVASVTQSGVVTGTGIGTAALVAATPWGSVDTAYAFVQGEILITSTRDGTPDLFTLDRATPGVLNPVVTDDRAVDAGGAFSPDGSRIAFLSSRDGNLEVYVANADGTDPQRLTTTEGANEDSPSWTPDGAQIVYVSQPRGQRAQIWIMNADGSDPRQLTSGEATNFEAAVSPDGGTIAFTSTRDGNYEIYLMGTDGADQRNVTQSASKESHAAWFPDGQLAYTREQQSGNTFAARVIRHDLTAGTASAISPEGLAVTDFDVAPDGGALALEVSAFESGGGISRKIYIVEVALGAAPVEIPRRDASEQQSGPAFRPHHR